jgi:hypothetical protein
VDLNGQEFSLPNLLMSMGQGAAMGAVHGFWRSIIRDLYLRYHGRNVSFREALDNAFMSMGEEAFWGAVTLGAIKGGWTKALSKEWFSVGIDLAGGSGIIRGFFEGRKASLASVEGRSNIRQLGVLIACEAIEY